jgi:glyoxylase-like metal-dependent hydrolase (beta-lactamase superfamily II)
MVLHRFINTYREANTYVVEVADGKVVIIDFGDYDLEDFCNWLKNNNKEIAAVFLTHEHSDHCSGLDALYERFQFTLYCSEKCEKNIRDKKQNFSYYIDRTPFELTLPAAIVKEGETIRIGDRGFEIIETPGHSPGGICIFTENAVFTGDTILNGTKTPLSFPHSSKKDYKESIQKILSLLEPGMMIYPGHHEPFVYESEESLVV